MPADRFAGFPSRAEQWFASMLGESDWSRVAARASEHETVVRGPMIALCEALAAEFGPAHVWHLHRNPWLWSHQVATVAVADNIGLRVELSLDALRVSGDWQNSSADQVERYRASVATTTGEWLADTVAWLSRTGFTIGGHRLARPPRGTPLNHPRGHLVRHRTLTVSREWPAGAWLASRMALRRTRQAWRALDPLVRWLGEHIGPRHQP
jgi:hypothetical protein